MDFHKLIERDFVLLDGAMGTMLQQKGMSPGTIPETLNITQPDWIRDIHRQYIEAGADIVYTNTFGANCEKLAGTAYTAPQLIEAAVSLAKEMCIRDRRSVSRACSTGTVLSESSAISPEATRFAASRRYRSRYPRDNPARSSSLHAARVSAVGKV